MSVEPMKTENMQRPGVTYLGNVGPVPLYMDVSAIFLVVFVIGFWGGSIAQRMIALAVLVLSIVAHEMGHALMARARHADGVSIYLTGLGGLCRYDSIVHPKDNMLIAMAGPFMNVVLAGIGWLVLEYVPREWFQSETGEIAFIFSWYLLYVNLFLAVLNSLPIYPMDGGQALLAGLNLKGYSQHRCRKATLITSFVAAGVGIAVYTLVTGEAIDMFLTGLLLYLLYQAYTELS